MMFAPAITCVFVLGVFWRRGTKEASLATLISGAIAGAIYFIIDLPVFGNIQWVTDPVNGLGIPFMMAGLFLLAFCVVVFVIVSLLTPKPTEVQLTNLCWDRPFQALATGKIKGITDPRMMAMILFVVMFTLYMILK
jgi:SSS family solute:Na+ symporter